MFIQSQLLFRDGQALLVACSGGLDSTVLLHVLNRLAVRHGWRLTVAHFDHRLRGTASGADAAWTKREARRLGLRFIGGRGEVRRLADRKRLSLEMAGRELRHKFLAAAARRLRITTVALAHHADDQVELFFLRLLR